MLLASSNTFNRSVLFHISKILYSNTIKCHFLLGDVIHLLDNGGDLRDLRGSSSNEGSRDDIDVDGWLGEREGVVDH